MQPELPLAGLIAVELGTSVAGPTAGHVLGTLGADVFKIESPGGDDARAWGPPFAGDVAALFHAVNRDKRSAVVDFRDETQCTALRDFIVARADIVVQNLRPGVVEKFALDGASLVARKPALIYCNIGAFGANGPLRDRPGYDPLMQAFGGIMSITGDEGRPPVRVGPSIVDQGAALWAVIGILSALHQRTHTGRGCVVSTSLYEAALGWIAMHAANYVASGQVPKRLGTENPSLAPGRAFETSDGWIIIAVGNDKLFRQFCHALCKPEWLDDPEFRSNPERVRHRVRLNDLIAAEIVKAPREMWLARLDKVGVPCAPMLTIDEVLAHPQSKAVGMLQPAPGDAPAAMGIPLQFDGKRPPFRKLAPKLGDATAVVLGNSAGSAAE